jgi:hypothetical protein
VKTVLTLVTGSSAASREAGIRALIDRAPHAPTALILEGLPTGADQFDSLPHPPHIARIALGCICCTGNLPMRVTLDRSLRKRPERLFIGLASTEHLPAIEAFLRAAPYDEWLTLAPLQHFPA